MKKFVLTACCIFVLAGMALAQDGSVSWASISAGFMTAQTNSTQTSPFFFGGPTGSGSIGAAGGSASLGTGFYYELLFNSYHGSQAAAPTSFAQLATWTDSGLEATNSDTAGRLVPINPNFGVNLTGFSQGGTGNANTNGILLFGWSANLGSSYAAAVANAQDGDYLGNAYIGVSNTGYIQGFAPGTVPGALPFGGGTVVNDGLGIYSLNTQLYLIPPMPEPGTIALAALGGLALLAARRRR